MRAVIVLGLMGISSLAYAQDWTNVKVWKTAGKSAYSDIPPNLRLEKVHIFYPRTQKLSPEINEKAHKRKPNMPIETEPEYDVENISNKQIDEWVSSAFLAKHTITDTERARRSACQIAHEELQQATQTQNTAAMQQAEAQVVQHCVGDIQATAF